MVQNAPLGRKLAGPVRLQCCKMHRHVGDRGGVRGFSAAKCTSGREIWVDVEFHWRRMHHQTVTSTGFRDSTGAKCSDGRPSGAVTAFHWSRKQQYARSKGTGLSSGETMASAPAPDQSSCVRRRLAASRVAPV